MVGLDYGLMTTVQRRKNAFSPSSISGLSAWYDPSDLSTLYQDVAMTVPVTASGQSVAVMRDKSGNGRHMVQTSAAARPIYQAAAGKHWLQFDGVDDFMVVGTFAWGASNTAMTLLAGANALGSNPVATLCELSASSSSNTGVFAIFDNGPLAGSEYVTVRSGGSAPNLTQANIGPLPHKSVYAMRADIAADVLRLRRNGVQVVNATGDQGSGAYGGSYPLYLGSRGGSTYPFAGSVYGLSIYSRMLSDAEVAQGEAWFAAKSEVTL